MEESNIDRLTWGLNPADDLADLLKTGALPKLQYLNIRRAKVGHAGASLVQLTPRLTGENGISTLVLDGIKLAGSKVLKEILGVYTHK